MTQTIYSKTIKVFAQHTHQNLLEDLCLVQWSCLKFYLFSWKIEHTEKEVQKVDDHWMRKLKVFSSSKKGRPQGRPTSDSI